MYTNKGTKTVFRQNCFASIGYVCYLFRKNFYHSGFFVANFMLQLRTSDNITILCLFVRTFCFLKLLWFVILYNLGVFCCESNFLPHILCRRPFYVAQSETVVTQHANWNRPESNKYFPTINNLLRSDIGWLQTFDPLFAIFRGQNFNDALDLFCISPFSNCSPASCGSEI